MNVIKSSDVSTVLESMKSATNIVQLNELHVQGIRIATESKNQPLTVIAMVLQAYDHNLNRLEWSMKSADEIATELVPVWDKLVEVVALASYSQRLNDSQRGELTKIRETLQTLHGYLSRFSSSEWKGGK